MENGSLVYRVARNERDIEVIEAHDHERDQRIANHETRITSLENESKNRRARTMAMPNWIIGTIAVLVSVLGVLASVWLSGGIP